MQIRLSTPDERDSLVAIWRSAVEATHTFLSAQDIESIEPIVRDMALVHLEVWVLCEHDTPIGFMGLEGNKVEALFIAPAHAGKGGGRRMLAHARALKGPLFVDVNEQNPAATAFYLANGFTIQGRSPIDTEGRPFPLLHLAQAGA
ncbi:acetyltransferase [Dyella sp.]|uniref:acetyltransferase n=1 Tax=Dyella sp. TaxID=1869338 RepID=UPI002ED683B4